MVNLFYSIIAAQNKDADDWINMLVFIVLAVFWAIGGIAKARSKKKGRPNERKQPEMPRIRPKSFEDRVQTIRERLEFAKSQFQERQIQEIEEETEPQIAQMPAKRYTEQKKPQGLVSDFARETKIKPLESDITEQLPEELADDYLLNLFGQDNLKRAIVYSEILGKPVSLREHNIG